MKVLDNRSLVCRHFICTGYVCLTIGVALILLGHGIVCIDKDACKPKL